MAFLPDLMLLMLSAQTVPYALVVNEDMIALTFIDHQVIAFLSEVHISYPGQKESSHCVLCHLPKFSDVYAEFISET